MPSSAKDYLVAGCFSDLLEADLAVTPHAYFFICYFLQQLRLEGPVISLRPRQVARLLGGPQIAQKLACAVKGLHETIADPKSNIGAAIYAGSTVVQLCNGRRPTSYPDAEQEITASVALVLLLQGILELMPGLEMDAWKDGALRSTLTMNHAKNRGPNLSKTMLFWFVELNSETLSFVEVKKRMRCFQTEELVLQEGTEAVSWLPHNNLPRMRRRNIRNPVLPAQRTSTTANTLDAIRHSPAPLSFTSKYLSRKRKQYNEAYETIQDPGWVDFAIRLISDAEAAGKRNLKAYVLL
ncbi:hypothetical protein CDV55_106193 [Aspergillus turcosus]|nr:hypothetical protein CDV55_106193 [Aspergillus turcosus]